MYLPGIGAIPGTSVTERISGDILMRHNGELLVARPAGETCRRLPKRYDDYRPKVLAFGPGEARRTRYAKDDALHAAARG